ncbi:ABC transporter permease [Acidobacterium sp. S8]|uniref:ABC transporter permease n=1 Tax=Acidobacterium sp. S8 TaxID=1641854 RepID=UPI00131AED2C|nr:ABC transporter permease [Acidobacterium sp. S8]
MAFFEDLRFALRQIGKAPGFAATAIVTLALGIGANTAIFSVIHAVLMHPSGVDAPERVAVMRTEYKQLGLDFPVVSVPDFADAASMKNQVDAAALEEGDSMNLVHDGVTEHFNADRVTWQWFQVFGAKPILGRTFAPEEDHAGANQVVVLSYAAWRRVFGGDRNVIGQSVVLDQKPYRVIGVMRSDFDWPRDKDMWIPMGLAPDAYDDGNRFNESYNAALRLKPGVSVEQLNAGLVAKSHEEVLRKGSGGFGGSARWGMTATSLTEFAAGPLRKPLYVLFGVVVLVLLIASANVAGLFLARSSTRTREFAIRTALGANAWRLVRQMMTETLMLASMATIIGIALGPVFGRMLLWMVPQSMAEGYTVQTSFGVLAFTAGIGILTALIAGLAPAAKIVSAQKKLELHEGGRSATASVDKQRMRSVFVIAEVALAFMLLTGTGLFLASLQQLQQVNPGFNPQGVAEGKVFYSGQAYKEDQQRQGTFVSSVLDNLSAQPGVKAAAAITFLPFTDGSSANSFNIEGRPRSTTDPGPHSQLSFATANYLKVMQIPLVAGRWVSDEDRSNTQPVVVIDQRLAHKYWPNQNPIGQHLRFDDGKQWSEVIGVVGDIRVSSLEEDTSDGMRYYPYAQGTNDRAIFVVRTDGDAAGMISGLKRAVAGIDPSQTVADTGTLEAAVNASLAPRKLIVWLLTAFAGLALVLALVGIYGLISYVTAQRTNEIGIRMALGAQRLQVVSLVMKGALAWVGIGLVIGIAMSMLATEMLRQQFADFGNGVVSSLAIAVAALLTIGSVAGLLPARRAASVDPATTLRNE